MDTNTTTGSVAVDGARIAFDISGPDDATTVVLAHGFAANRHWWDAVLPRLATVVRVVRVDFSGHGDSAYRDRYTIRQWAEEFTAVQRATSGDEAVLAVGHSFGGRVAIESACVPDTRTAAVLALDTSFRMPQDHRGDAAWPRPRRVYPSEEDAIDRFRLVPPQPIDDGILRALAAASVRRAADGWEWKHDHDLRPEEVGATRFTGLDVPFDIAYGELSTVVDPATIAAAAAIDPATTVTVIPGAHHHLVLDAPDAAAGIIIDAARRHLGRRVSQRP